MCWLVGKVVIVNGLCAASLDAPLGAMSAMFSFKSIRVPESTVSTAQAIISSYRRVSTVAVWNDLIRGVIG